jgi:hypothetical protein
MHLSAKHNASEEFLRAEAVLPNRDRDRSPPIPVPPLTGKKVKKVGFPRFVPESDVADERS